MKTLSAPLDVCLAITGKCNLRCKHCCAKETWGEKDLTTEEMFDLIDQLGRAKVFSIAIFGGEPLMREDLFILIERLRKYPIGLSMNTNGTLITKDIAKTLIKKYRIKGYVVSLDGTKEIHEKMRGRGTFNPAVRGMENLIKEGGSVLLSTTVTKLNINNLEEIVKIGKELGVRQVRFNHVFYTGNALCYMREVFVPPKEEKDACYRVYELSKKYGNFITGSYLQQYEKFKQLGKRKPEKVIKVPPCGAATRKCAIRPDGYVTPCEVIWEVKAGNVKNRKFTDIWRNSKIMKEFRKTLYIDTEKMPECKDCEYQFICFWGHRCSPYYYPGGVENKKLYCYKL